MCSRAPANDSPGDGYTFIPSVSASQVVSRSPTVSAHSYRDSPAHCFTDTPTMSRSTSLADLLALQLESFELTERSATTDIYAPNLAARIRAMRASVDAMRALVDDSRGLVGASGARIDAVRIDAARALQETFCAEMIALVTDLEAARRAQIAPQHHELSE